jgi:hypothetical protein
MPIGSNFGRSLATTHHLRRGLPADFPPALLERAGLPVAFFGPTDLAVLPLGLSLPGLEREDVALSVLALLALALPALEREDVALSVPALPGLALSVLEREGFVDSLLALLGLSLPAVERKDVAL